MLWSSTSVVTYPDLSGSDRLLTLIVYGNPLQVAIGGTEWLAFNPAVAARLGWTFSDEGLFRWVNAERKTMVESIWWQDGPMDRQPPRSNEVTGEGWLVVASPEAQISILRHFSPITIMRAVKRSFKKDSQDFDDYSIDTRAWPH